MKTKRTKRKAIVTELNPNTLTIILNVNGTNTPTKKSEISQTV